MLSRLAPAATPGGPGRLTAARSIYSVLNLEKFMVTPLKGTTP